MTTTGNRNTVAGRTSLISIKELSAYLGVPVQTIYTWNTRGTGPRPIHVGRHVRYQWDDVDAWVDRGGTA